MAMYAVIFVLALLVNLVITFRSSVYWNRYCQSRNSSSSNETVADPQEVSRHSRLLRTYLAVYLLATLSDWLQGPYVYALYDAYGFSQHAIAILFVAGFGSSMVFGSFVGGMADWGGRRRFVVLFAVTYAASCLTKHFNNFHVLMLGRLLGGIATSLLFSVFEAWLIRSHSDAKLGKSFLSLSFSSAAYGNSVIAIIAGLVANKAASSTEMVPVYGSFHVGGFLTPFDIALMALVLCGFLCATTWDENYGEESKQSGGGSRSDDGRSAPHWYDGLKNAFTTTMRSRDILLCGIISSLFEGSMYIFVFMWTPALTVHLQESDGTLPFGLIFSTFMVCCMAGSSLFSIAIGNIKGEALAVGVFGCSAIAMAMVALSQSDTMAFIAMNMFEMCVGMYFPIMGTMKGSIVPEDKRAAIYNLFRIPLNFIVLFSLLTDLTATQSFSLNCAMLSVATVLQFILMQRRSCMSSTSDNNQEGSIPASITAEEEVHLADAMESSA